MTSSTPPTPGGTSAVPRVTVDSLITKPQPGSADPRITLLGLGFEKSGKSTLALSLPEPILCIQTDPNREALKAAVAAGRDIQVVDVSVDAGPEAWRDFRQVLLPALVNRELPIASIVLDSYAYMFQSLQTFTPKTENGFEYWDKVRTEADKTTRQLVETASVYPSDPTRPRYHVAVTCHLQELTNDKGSVIGFRPAVQGGFKNELGRIFGTVLYLEGGSEQVFEAGKPPKRVAVHRAHTVSPNEYIRCGDSVGSPIGKWNVLPPTIDEPSYEKLADLWGFPKAPAVPAKPAEATP